MATTSAIADATGDWKPMFLSLLDGARNDLDLVMNDITAESTLLTYKRYPFNAALRRPCKFDENPVPEQNEFNENYKELTGPIFLAQEENNKQREPVNRKRADTSKELNEELKDVLDSLVKNYRDAVAKRVAETKIELVQKFINAAGGIGRRLSEWPQFDHTEYPYHRALAHYIAQLDKSFKNCPVSATKVTAQCDREINLLLCECYATQKIIYRLIDNLKLAAENAKSYKNIFSVKFNLIHSGDLSAKRSFFMSLLKCYEDLLDECQSLPFAERDSFADKVGKQQAYLADCIVATMLNSRTPSLADGSFHELDLYKDWSHIVDSVKVRYMLQRQKHSANSDLVPRKMLDLSEAELRRVCGIISECHPKQQWAFFLCQNGVYYYRIEQSKRKHLSPLLRLIMGCFYSEFRKPKRAGTALALPAPSQPTKLDCFWMPVVYTNYTLSPGELNFLSFHAHEKFVERRGPLVERIVEQKQPPVGINFSENVLRIYSLMCVGLMATTWGVKTMTNCISALLVGPDGAILAYSVNTVPDSNHQTQHAEANLFYHYRGDIPAGFYAFSSLKSCTSCAGVMFQALKELNGKLYFECPDEGDRAVNTCAEKYNYEFHFPLGLDSPSTLEAYQNMVGTAGIRQSARKPTFRAALVELQQLMHAGETLPADEQTALAAVSELLTKLNT